MQKFIAALNRGLALCVASLLTLGFVTAACAQEQKSKLAVVDFEVKGSVSEKQAGEIVAGLFGTSLSDKYVVLERQQVSRVIDEQKFQLSDLVSDKGKVARIGQLLGAAYIVVGTVSQLGTTVTVQARVVDVTTGEWGERGYIYCEGIGEIPKNLPALLSKMKLLGEGGLSVPVPKEVSGPMSERDETFKGLISKASASLSAGKPEDALEFVRQASEIPGFENDANVKWLQQRASKALADRNKQQVQSLLSEVRGLLNNKLIDLPTYTHAQMLLKNVSELGEARNTEGFTEGFTLWQRLEKLDRKSNNGRFVYHDGMISDRESGLTWTVDPLQGERYFDRNQVEYRTALQWCTDLSLGGYKNWRLPSSHELMGVTDAISSLLYDERNFLHANDFFNRFFGFWSSDAVIQSNSISSQINTNYNVYGLNFVRAVRKNSE